MLDHEADSRKMVLEGSIPLHCTGYWGHCAQGHTALVLF